MDGEDPSPGRGRRPGAPSSPSRAAPAARARTAGRPASTQPGRPQPPRNAQPQPRPRDASPQRRAGEQGRQRQAGEQSRQRQAGQQSEQRPASRQSRPVREPGARTVRPSSSGRARTVAPDRRRRPPAPPPRPPRLRGWRPPPDPARRLRVALVVMLFLLSLFGGRLIQVQGLDASALAAQALKNRTRSQPLFAHRGDILDAAGATLATTVELRDIRVDQTLVARYKRQVGEDRSTVGLRGAAEDLAPLLGQSVDALAAKLTGTSRGATIARGVAPDVARQVLRLAIPGLATYQTSRRLYPSGQVAANVLGFVGTGDGTAHGGLEQAYNRQLAGTPGKITYEQSLDGAQIPTGVLADVDPRDGCTIRTTIDRDLQWKAQQLLSAQVSSLQAKGGYAVVVDTRTFDVRALAVVPTYDPNHPEKAGQSTLNDRSLLDTFEPGSTAKVITLAAALEEKSSTPATKVTVPPVLRRADVTFHDAELHGTEQLTVAGVLAQSSNIGTILTGEKLAPVTLDKYLRLFGLGAPTGIGLAESPGLLAPYQQWSGSQRYTVMFGQGLSVTTLQAADVFATLANDGVRRQPRIVSGQTCADGVFRPAPATDGLRVVSADTARQMRLMMEQVVSTNGTAIRAAIPGYRVAGKTGTAQYPDGHGGYQDGAYTASFIGMAPADDPHLVVAVVLDRPKHDYFGGQAAAPVFSQLMAYALAQQKIPPTGTTTPRMTLRWN